MGLLPEVLLRMTFIRQIPPTPAQTAAGRDITGSAAKHWDSAPATLATSTVGPA